MTKPPAVSAARVATLQKADVIWLEEIRKTGLYDITSKPPGTIAWE